MCRIIRRSIVSNELFVFARLKRRNVFSRSPGLPSLPSLAHKSAMNYTAKGRVIPIVSFPSSSRRSAGVLSMIIDGKKCAMFLDSFFIRPAESRPLLINIQKSMPSSARLFLVFSPAFRSRSEARRPHTPKIENHGPYLNRRTRFIIHRAFQKRLLRPPNSG